MKRYLIFLLEDLSMIVNLREQKRDMSQMQITTG